MPVKTGFIEENKFCPHIKSVRLSVRLTEWHSLNSESSLYPPNKKAENAPSSTNLSYEDIASGCFCFQVPAVKIYKMHRGNLYSLNFTSRHRKTK